MKLKDLAIAILILLSSVKIVEAQLILRSSKISVAGALAFSSMPGILLLISTNSPISSFSLGSIAAAGGWWWAYRSTPEYKLDKAKEHFAEIYNTQEYCIAEFHRQDSLKTMKHDVEKIYVASENPLFSCFDTYSAMRSKILAALKLSESVYTELKDSSNDAKALELAQDAENCFIDLLEAQENVEIAMLALKKDSSWHKSLKAKYSKDAAEEAQKFAIATQINAMTNTVHAIQHKS